MEMPMTDYIVYPTESLKLRAIARECFGLCASATDITKKLECAWYGVTADSPQAATEAALNAGFRPEDDHKPGPFAANL
jgi:hypothetical protein